MELVYLWVEEYKNIKKQGFNFSPRFKCKFYDEYEENQNGIRKLKNNCKLEIEDKKDIRNFFDKEGKVSITTIVGKNGSGKSSLLELLNDMGFENPEKDPYPIRTSDLNKIAIIYDKKINKLYINKQNINVNIKNNSSTEEENQVDENFQKILITPTPKHSQQEYLTLLDFFTKENISFPFETPKYVEIGIHDDYYELLETIENSSFDFYSIYNIFEENLNRRFKLFYIILILTYLKNYQLDFDIKASEDYDNTISELEAIIEPSIKEQISKLIEEAKNNLESFSQNPAHYIDIKKISNTFFNSYIEIIKRKNESELLNFKGKNVFFFNLHPKMSDGQYQFTYLFNNIYSSIKDNENILLLIDEGENYLHPNWQKKYLSFILKFIKMNFPNNYIHIILTTHSPFLLSDMPKENIIYLDIDDNHNSKVIDGLKEKKQTFGANIHTLLSDSFFMDGGLMGEFAKGKIEEIKKFYEIVKKLEERILSKDSTKKLAKKSFEKRKKRFEHIQTIIGEPFLQTVIKNYIDEIKILLSDDNTLIDNEINQLEAKIKKLKSLKNG